MKTMMNKEREREGKKNELGKICVNGDRELESYKHTHTEKERERERLGKKEKGVKNEII